MGPQVTQLVQAQLPPAAAAAFNGYGMAGQYGAQHPGMMTQAAATVAAAQLLSGGFPVRACSSCRLVLRVSTSQQAPAAVMEEEATVSAAMRAGCRMDADCGRAADVGRDIHDRPTTTTSTSTRSSLRTRRGCRVACTRVTTWRSSSIWNLV
jgi:hypothetical protein